MTKVISIYEAKTHLSKYIKQAKSGKPVYIGGYGKEEVMLVPAAPMKPPIKLGVWKDRPLGYKDEDLIGSDPDIVEDFEVSTNRPLPE